MNKTEFVAAVAEKAGIAKKDADAAVKAVLDTLSDALAKGESVAFTGFGTFGVKDHPERQGVNPKDGSKIVIAAKRAPIFKAGKGLKDIVNK